MTIALNGLARGYAVVSVDYRLSGEAQFPKQINDIKAAIRFIKANSGKYNLNSDKIATWGSSAGGNLSALPGTSGKVKELEDLPLGNPEQTSVVQTVLDWYGPINSGVMDDQFKESGIKGETHNSASSFKSEVLGKAITEVPDLVKTTNPETYITTEDPPFFIQHGTADKNIPTAQSVNFAANLEKVLDFLDKHLK